MSSSTKKKILCLFDVDGTLTKPRQKIDKDLDQFLSTTIKPLCNVAIVGGSDLNKIIEQMDGDDVIHRFDYVFSENGLVAYKYGELLNCESIQRFLGEEKLQTFINFVLSYLSTLHLPIKRGTFVEFRQGMLNISPIGRNCSRQERDDFERYDKVHKIRQTMIEAIRDRFADYNLTYSIGGQISFDVFPNGWDKTYCLRHLESDGFDEIHFFGDKTDKGGNDYEIYIDDRIIGHKVRDPDDTKRELLKLFNLN